MNRKTFLLRGGASVLALLPGSLLLAQTTSPSPSGALPDFPEHDPQHDRALVKQFVVAAHASLPKVKELLGAHPTLVNATWDWGNGDFETALGGAAHMGRADIAEFLLEQNARLDIFAATMLGQLEIVKAAVAAYPKIVSVPGPHGIPLLVHAQKGGQRAAAVLEFLQSLGR